MDWQIEYTGETGKDAQYGHEPFKYPGRLDYYYYDEYIEWLEAKLTTASQPNNAADAKKERFKMLPFGHEAMPYG